MPCISLAFHCLRMLRHAWNKWVFATLTILALLQESDVDHIFLDKKDILKHRRLVKIITVLHLELTPSGQRQFFMTDTMATVEDRILNRRYLATEYRMARSSDSTCLSCCIIFTSGLFLGAFLLLHLIQYSPFETLRVPNLTHAKMYQSLCFH